MSAWFAWAAQYEYLDLDVDGELSMSTVIFSFDFVKCVRFQIRSDLFHISVWRSQQSHGIEMKLFMSNKRTKYLWFNCILFFQPSSTLNQSVFLIIVAVTSHNGTATVMLTRVQKLKAKSQNHTFMHFSFILAGPYKRSSPEILKRGYNYNNLRQLYNKQTALFND